MEEIKKRILQSLDLLCLNPRRSLSISSTAVVETILKLI
jgi:hypothetical protein